MDSGSGPGGPDLETLGRRTSRLQRVTEALSQALTVKEIGHVVSSQGRDLFGATASLAYVLDLDSDALEVVAFGGVAEERVESYRRIPLSTTGMPLTDALRSGSALFVGSHEELSARYPAYAKIEFSGARLCGIVVLPMRGSRALVGALAFSYYVPPVLDEIQRDLFLTVASQCGLAIERAQVFESERRAHAAADAARAQLHGLFMQAPAAIAIARGPELRFELVNEPYQQLFGRDLQGRPAGESSPLLAEQGVLDLMRRVYRTGERFSSPELTVQLPNEPESRVLDLVLQPTRDASSNIDGVAAFAYDVTLRVRAQRRIEALAESVARHAATVTTLNELGQVIAAELDIQKVVQAVTDAATQVTGAQFGAFFYNVFDDEGGRYTLYTISGVAREHFSKFPMPRNTAVFAPTFTGEGVVRSDDITLDPRYAQNAPHHGMPPGHLPVRSYLAVPVVSRAGEVIGGIFLGHEQTAVFTERSQRLAVGIATQAAIAVDNARLYGNAQRLIKALEASNRELDQFAYVTSHDLKAPLRGIGSLAEWIDEDAGEALNPDARKKLSLLRGRVRRMESLIQGILEFSRAGRAGGKREDVDLARLVGEVSELLAPQPPATVAFEGENLTLSTTRTALQQVLMNLIGNGLKHARRADARVTVAGRATELGWEVRVRDNGPGIEARFHDRVWGIFQTLEARDTSENTGIGLAIVKKIVEGRGGRVWIESAPGEGATFAFTWPKPEDPRT